MSDRSGWWMLKEQLKSVCPYCAIGCGLLVTTKDGVIDQVRGDPDHASNLGRLCVKGALLPAMLKAPGRLLYPQVRESLDQPFRRVTWDEALQFAADRMRPIRDEHGPDAVAFYGSGQLMTEDYYLLGKLAKGYIGTNNQDTNSRLCMTSSGSAYAMAFGQDGPPAAYDDIESTDCVLILGANMEACHPVLFQRLQERKRRHPQTRIIVIDPRKTQTARIADIYLPVRPGTDVALLNAMLHEIILSGLADEAYIAENTTGWEALRDELRYYAPERVARLCGVDAEEIREAALIYARAYAALSFWAMGANQSIAGVDKNLGLINLALATGNIGRKGAGPFSLTGQPNAMGGREAGGMAHTLPGHRLIASPEHRAEIEAFWGIEPGTISEKPGLTAVDMFKALDAGDVKAVWIAATNPVASMPNAGRIKAALDRAELVVVQDAYHPTETTRQAHVLLPAAQWSERTGTMTNAERRVLLVEQITSPPGEALPDWEILCRLADKMGFGQAFNYAGSEAIFDELKSATARRDLDMTGMTYDRLRQTGGLQWPMPAGKAKGTTRLYAEGTFPSTSGKASFNVTRYTPAAERQDEEYPYVLTTGRVKDHWHTMTRTGKVAKLVAASPAPFVEINVEDARNLGVKNGQLVELTSKLGTVRMPARVTRHIRRGTLFTPFHWGELWSAQTAVNLLTHEAYDPISKEPELKHCPVQVAVVRERASATSPKPVTTPTILESVGGSSWSL
jgi:ferredoxin-nitrate reductase